MGNISVISRLFTLSAKSGLKLTTGLRGGGRASISLNLAGYNTAFAQICQFSTFALLASQYTCIVIASTLGFSCGWKNTLTRHWRDSRSRENLERKWFIFFYLELENWIFISRDVLECQDFEEKILVLLSKFEIWKKNSLSLLEGMRFCKQILFLFSILHSISLPILVRNHILLFGLILTISVLQKGKVF